jgi:hypothetical protein
LTAHSRQDFSEGMLIMRWMAFGSALLAAAVVQAPVAQATAIFATSLILQLSLEVRRRAMAASFPVTDLGGGLMQASPQ